MADRTLGRAVALKKLASVLEFDVERHGGRVTVTVEGLPPEGAAAVLRAFFGAPRRQEDDVRAWCDVLHPAPSVELRVVQALRPKVTLGSLLDPKHAA